MATDEPEIHARSEVLLMEDLLTLVDDGRLRVPRFPRPFVWRPQQILDLFDSIERGYPIGSLLIWETSEEYTTYDSIGGLPAPEATVPGVGASYVLDGHQRLASLYGSLRRPADAPRSTEQQDWMWWPYRILGEVDEGFNRYRHWKQADPPPRHYLPVRVTQRTFDFLAFIRELFDNPPEGRDPDPLVREAEVVAQRIRSYQIPVVRLIGGTLWNATEVFSRINTSGQAMRPSDLMSAFMYRNNESTLAEDLGAIVEQVAEIGFGEVSTETVFRIVLTIAGEDSLQGVRWGVLARASRKDVRDLLEKTEAALIRAVDFLRHTVGVPLARLIPYDFQLMLLATFFHHRPDPGAQQLAELTRWFWATSWSAFFAGANTVQVRQAIQQMRHLAENGGSITPWEVPVRPFPDRFDLRSARVRAFIIWELQEFSNRLAWDGSEFNTVDLLAQGATLAYRRIVKERGLSVVSSPANRLIMVTAPGMSVKSALLELPASRRDRVLTSHGIPAEAMDRLAAGDDEGFIKVRRDFLTGRERVFMARFGLVATPGEGDTDIDTE